MKSLKLYLLIVFAIITSYQAFTKPDFGINGYLFNLASFTHSYQNSLYNLIEIPSSNSYTDLLRARFKPILNINDNLRIEAQYEFNGMVSDRNLFVLTEISENRRQLFKIAQNIYTDEHSVINHYLDRFYIKYNDDFMAVTAGRQRISWGVGRIWQPTDLFNPLNPANFSKIEKDGADAVSAKFFLGYFTDIEIVYNPTMSKYSDNFGARFRTNISEYDMSLLGGRFDNRNILGLDFTGNLFDAGLRGEAIYSFNSDDGIKDFLKFIIGLDYQFNSELYALIEYQHNGEGSSDKLNYDFIRLANAEILNVAKNYLAINAAYRLNDSGTLGASNIINFDDGSGLSALSYIYQYSQNLQFNASAMLTYGSKGSEYRFYPLSVYLISEYYF